MLWVHLLFGKDASTMHKAAGFLLTAAILLPVGLVASPASAAAGTTCAPPSGTITASPGITATPKVQTITINLPITGCKAGGVTGGTFTGSLKTTPISLGNFAKTAASLKLTSTIKWKPTGTSTLVATSVTKIVGKSIVSTVTGKISKGTFANLTFKSVQTVTLGPLVGGAVKNLTIKGTTPITIS